MATNIPLPVQSALAYGTQGGPPGNRDLKVQTLKPIDQDSGVDPFIDLTAVPGPQNQNLEITPFWGNSPRSWDTVTAGPLVLPGLAEVTGNIEMAQDRKRAAGTNGQRLTFLGWKPAVIKIQLRIWTPAHWDTLKRLADMIKPPPNQKAPLSYDIAHPALALWRIASVQFTNCGFPKPESNGSDIYTVDITATEFFPEPKKTKVTTNKGAQPLLASKSEVIFSTAERKAGPAFTEGPNASFEPNVTPNQSLP